MNRRGFIEKILLALFIAVIFLAQSNPLLSLAPPEEAMISSAGQSPPAEGGLTLTTAAEIALRHNPLLQATSSAEEIAAAQLSEARAGRWPLLQFNETFTNGNNPVFVFGSLLEQRRFGLQNFAIDSLNNPDSLSNFRTALTLKVPIFDQLETGTRIAQARIGQEQADRQKELIRQQVRFEVLRAYYGILVAQTRRDVAAEAVYTAETDVRQIRDRFETGLVVQSDLLAAEVQLAEFRQQEVQAAGDLVTAYAFLNTALGLPVQTKQKVTPLPVEKTFPVPEPEDLIRLALLHRPDYARAKFSVQSAEEKVRGAWGQYLPKLDLFSTYGMSSRDLVTGTPDYAVGAGLTYNLLIWAAARKSTERGRHNPWRPLNRNTWPTRFAWRSSVPTSNSSPRATDWPWRLGPLTKQKKRCASFAIGISRDFSSSPKSFAPRPRWCAHA